MTEELLNDLIELGRLSRVIGMAEAIQTITDMTCEDQSINTQA